MNPALALFRNAFAETLASIAHNWPYLLASILIAAALKAFIDTDKVAGFLRRWKGASVLAATGAAVATPFCSCGTTAVVLGMIASTMPLAPIVAFMVASPMSSPEELFYSAGLFGWPFAIFYFAVSIILGLAGGGIAAFLEKRGLLAGQTRFAGYPQSGPASESTCSCPRPEGDKPRVYRMVQPSPAPLLATSSAALCDCAEAAGIASPTPSSLERTKEFLGAVLGVGQKLLPMFVGFAFVGYLLNGLIPASLISTLFGQGHAYSVPLAATIGLPLYVSSEASLPLIRAFLDSGMSHGAVIAFLVAGSGTSIGAITGALTIVRWKVVGLVVAVLWLGAILAGYLFDFLVAAGAF